MDGVGEAVALNRHSLSPPSPHVKEEEEEEVLRALEI